MAVPYEASCQVWRHIVEKFKNREIIIDIKLFHIKQVFKSFGLELKYD